MENNQDTQVSRFGDGSGYKKKGQSSQTTQGSHSLKVGDNVVRILPPMFSCVERNIYAAYYARHWITASDGKRVPVVCTKSFNRKTGKWLETCQFCKAEEDRRVIFDKAQRAFQAKEQELKEAKGLSAEDQALLEDDVAALKEAFSMAREQYSPPDKKWWANVMTQDGRFDFLGLPKTVYEALAGKKEKGSNYRTGGLLDEMREKHELDGVSVTGGVWLNIKREGTDQFNTRYSVHPVTEIETIEVNGKTRKTEYLKEAPLSIEQQEECLKNCRDLNSLFDHVKFTEEEQTRILDSHNDSDVLMGIMRSKRPLTAQDLQQT